ncbi:MAG: HAMP domain-containing sensor histidine kinase [Alkalispirochaeta sp.]
MNLQRRFSLLVAGSVLAPIATVAFLVLTFGVLDIGEDQVSVTEIREVHRLLTSGLLTSGGVSSPTLEEILPALRESSADVSFAVLDENAQVVEQADNLQARLGGINSPTGYELAVVPVADRAGRVHTLLIAFPAPFQGGPWVAAIVMVITLLFTSIVAVSTVRSVRRSLGELDAATRRIAEGNLDIAVAIPEKDSFHPLAQSLMAMRDRIREEYDRQTRFFMGVSHDLKTPLASITGYSEALLDHVTQDPQQQARYAAIIRDKARVLERRITQLMQYIRLANGEFQETRKPQNLREFLGDLVDRYQEEASLTGRDLRVDTHPWMLPGSIVIPFDSDLVTRALENLVNNAFQHGKEGTPVHIAVDFSPAEPDSGRSAVSTIRVSNTTREHIDPEALDRLFDPFYRVDGARRGDGFGLGLAAVKSIIDGHGWSVTATCPTPNTLVVTIVIPVEVLVRDDFCG